MYDELGFLQTLLEDEVSIERSSETPHQVSSQVRFDALDRCTHVLKVGDGGRLLPRPSSINCNSALQNWRHI